MRQPWYGTDFSSGIPSDFVPLCYKPLRRGGGIYPSRCFFMNQVSPSPETLAAAREAVDILQRGGIILYPTDTIWGLGCDATNEEAVDRLSALKGRPTGKPMLMLVDSDVRIQSYVRTVPSMAYQLIDVAVRPLTIIYPEGRNVAPQLLADDGSIGIRIASDTLCQEICRMLRRPLVSTSANLAGTSSPHNYSEIDPALIKMVDYVVPLRQDEHIDGMPSDIIKLGLNNEVRVIR